MRDLVAETQLDVRQLVAPLFVREGITEPQPIASLPGVHGVRMTGGGFGGCIVALTEPGALAEGWKVTAVDGARVLDPDETNGEVVG